MNKFGSFRLCENVGMPQYFLAAGLAIFFLLVGCNKIPIYKNQNNLLKLQKGMASLEEGNVIESGTVINALRKRIENA